MGKSGSIQGSRILEDSDVKVLGLRGKGQVSGARVAWFSWRVPVFLKEVLTAPICKVNGARKVAKKRPCLCPNLQAQEAS